MDQKRPLRKDIVEAWNRFVDHAYTIEDLTLILDSLKGGDHLREFDEVSDRIRNDAFVNRPLLTEEQKDAYRREILQLLAEYEKSRIKNRESKIGVRFRKMWYAAAAAAVLLGILIPAAYHYSKPKTEQAETVVQYVEAVTQRGERKTVVLPDQTSVTLNAQSRIVYPDRFTGAERPVELYGEALFDVTSDPAKPFTVKTEHMNIRVVGTVFNVKEYEEDMAATILVASGKVEVNCKSEKALLERNQQVKVNRNTENLEKLAIDADSYLSWTDGTLYFHKTTLSEVVNMLNRCYPQNNVVLAEGDYSGYLISGKHDNKRVEAVLTSIVYSTGLQCKKQNNRYILYCKTVKP